MHRHYLNILAICAGRMPVGRATNLSFTVVEKHLRTKVN